MTAEFKAWAIGSVVIIVGLIAAILMIGSERYQDGKTAAESACKSRENTELAAANAEILRLTNKARQDEKDHAEAMAAASRTYQESSTHEKAAHDRAIADLRAGNLKLRIELARRQSADRSAAGTPGAGPGRCDGPATAELSQSAAEFLVDLASEADTVVHQLTACQAVVAADRKINATEGDPAK